MLFKPHSYLFALSQLLDDALYMLLKYVVIQICSWITQTLVLNKELYLCVKYVAMRVFCRDANIEGVPRAQVITVEGVLLCFVGRPTHCILNSDCTFLCRNVDGSLTNCISCQLQVLSDIKSSCDVMGRSTCSKPLCNDGHLGRSRCVTSCPCSYDH